MFKEGIGEINETWPDVSVVKISDPSPGESCCVCLQEDEWIELWALQYIVPKSSLKSRIWELWAMTDYDVNVENWAYIIYLLITRLDYPLEIHWFLIVSWMHVTRVAHQSTSTSNTENECHWASDISAACGHSEEFLVTLGCLFCCHPMASLDQNWHLASETGFGTCLCNFLIEHSLLSVLWCR